MNDDYLWDRTGEPDPEIQQLEEVLGSLRYQPQPLELPARVRIGRPRTFFPPIAIAAAVAAILVGGTAWLFLHRQNVSVGSLESPSNAPAAETLTTAPQKVAPAKDEAIAESAKNEALENKSSGRGIRKGLLAGNKQLRTSRAKHSELTARDRAEAETAKEQLLLALRVASEKLNLAQRKAQGGYPGNPIRNQHKVG
jgi:septal ring-binding cell division protein DamX